MADENITLPLKQDVPEEYRAKLLKIQNDSEFVNRTKDAGLIDFGNKSSVTLKNGQVNMAAGQFAYQKIGDSTGQIFTSSLEHIETTNRKNLTTDEIIINNHKLNRHLWELSDFKVAQFDDKYTIGDLTFDGAVLTRAWDAMLKKYVLMRVPYRGRFFSWEVNVPEIKAGLNIADPSKVVTNYPTKQSGTSVKDWYASVVTKVQENGKTVTTQNSDGTTAETTTTKSDDGNTIVYTKTIKDKDDNVVSIEKTIEVTADGVTKVTVETYDKDNKLVKTEGPTIKKAETSGSALAEYNIVKVEGGHNTNLINLLYTKHTDGSDKVHRKVRLTDSCKAVSGTMLVNSDEDLEKNFDYKNDANTYLQVAKNAYPSISVDILEVK